MESDGSWARVFAPIPGPSPRNDDLWRTESICIPRLAGRIARVDHIYCMYLYKIICMYYMQHVYILYYIYTVKTSKYMHGGRDRDGPEVV